ncbi:6-phosphogluconolactonase [Candidatus Woesearchaeota archaeon]|nr:6-phosphogluconolactonase [Candidatus Woesearchaeota archaeon]
MKLLKYPKREELIKHAASFITDEIEFLANQQEKIFIGLVGGTSTGKLYEELTKKNIKSWQKCHFFILDERYAPITSNESNYKTIKEKLLEPLLNKNLIQNKHVHRIKTELSGEKAAFDYSKKFEEFAGRIDIAILSSGEDGHVAGIFPEKEYTDKQAYEYFEDSPKLPKKRISIVPGALAMTKTAFVLFLGKEKKQALKSYLNNTEKTIPQQILDEIENTIIVTDQK